MREIITWPGWESVRPLGTGSFGKVYEIQRIDNGKTYKAALKVISIPQNQAEVENAYSEGMTEENVTTYFKSFVDDITKEFELMYDLKGYTNIVSYEEHEVRKREDGIGWDILIKMELLTPLQKWAETHSMDEATVVRLGCDICKALELCHKKKIIHRDIKPENIFVNSNGDFKLGDFGIARVAEKTTSVMSQKGSPPYMAPEVYKGYPYDETIDIYSLGIVLYRFLNNNRTPFLPMGQITYNDRMVSVEKRMSGEEIPAPVNGGEKLKKAILRSVQYDAQKRFQNVMAFRKVLEQCEEPGGIFEEPKSSIDVNEPPYGDVFYEDELTEVVVPKYVPPKKKKNWVVLIVAVAVIFICVLAVGLFGQKTNSENSNGIAMTNNNDSSVEEIGESKACMEIARYEWGTSKENIKNEIITDSMVLGTDYEEIDNQLILNTNILGYEMYIVYEFDSDEKLIATYLEMPETSSDEKYINAFMDIINEYQNKFGPYTKEKRYRSRERETVESEKRYLEGWELCNERTIEIKGNWSEWSENKVSSNENVEVCEQKMYK